MRSTHLHSSMDLTIVIPCFNEVNGIVRTVERVVAQIESLGKDSRFEIVLVDDGSEDGTQERLRCLESRFTQIRTVFLEAHCGRGAALRAGIRVCRGKWVLTLDADLSYDESHIALMWEALRSNPATDMVVVSPYMRGGQVIGVPLGRLCLSWMANWWLAGAFRENLSTVTCVVRGYRGRFIRSLDLREEGKEIHLEVLHQAILRRGNIQEVPGRLVWSRQKSARPPTCAIHRIGAIGRHIQFGIRISPYRPRHLLTLVTIAGFSAVALAMALGGTESTELGLQGGRLGASFLFSLLALTLLYVHRVRAVRHGAASVTPI